MTNNFELIFEKDYQLLQTINYSASDGTFKKAKDVVLKAPTMKNAEKFERALEKGSIAIIKFICENELMLSREGTPIVNLDELHALSLVKLAEDYLKFFFDLDSLRNKSLSKI